MSVNSLKKNRKTISGSDLLGSIEKKSAFSENPVGVPEQPSRKPMTQLLSSGHQVMIDFDGQEIEVEDPKGNVAVKIILEDSGPVVELQGARLSLKSPQAVSIDCEDFAVNAEKDLYMNAGGQLTIESTEELHLNCEMDIRIRANVIWLN